MILAEQRAQHTLSLEFVQEFCIYLCILHAGSCIYTCASVWLINKLSPTLQSHTVTISRQLLTGPAGLAPFASMPAQGTGMGCSNRVLQVLRFYAPTAKTADDLSRSCAKFIRPAETRYGGTSKRPNRYIVSQASQLVLGWRKNEKPNACTTKAGSLSSALEHAQCDPLC